MNKLDVITELQLLTGVDSDDISFLVMKMLDGGILKLSKKSEEIEEEVIVQEVPKVLTDSFVSDWFNSL